MGQAMHPADRRSSNASPNLQRRARRVLATHRARVASMPACVGRLAASGSGMERGEVMGECHSGRLDVLAAADHGARRRSSGRRRMTTRWSQIGTVGVGDVGDAEVDVGSQAPVELDLSGDTASRWSSR